MKPSRKNGGFTLIELLVVVLIIGILAAIAVPQYQKAVLKSRFSSLMPTTKSIRDGNEMFYMTNGHYAEAIAKLDVTTANTDDMTLTVSDDLDYAYTMATRPNISNNLIMYQKHSDNFPGEVHCEALKKDKRAIWLCEQALKGRKLGGSLTEGYSDYILEGEGKGITATAANVIAGVACAEGLSEAQCKIIDNADGSRTKKECSNPSDTTTCVYSTYHTDQTKTTCNEKGNATYNEETGVCTPTRHELGHPWTNNTSYREPYTTIYDEDGNPISSVACLGMYTSNPDKKWCYANYKYEYNPEGKINRVEGTQCSNYEEITTDGTCLLGNYDITYSLEYDSEKGGYFNEEGYKITSQRKCTTQKGNVNDGTCTEFDTNYNYDQTFDEHGELTSIRRCNSSRVRPDGTCTKYGEAGWSNYDIMREYNEKEQPTVSTFRYCSGDYINASDGSCLGYNRISTNTYTYDPDTGVRTSDITINDNCGTWNSATGTCATYVVASPKNYYDFYDRVTGAQTSGVTASCTNFSDNTNANSCTSWSVTVTPYENGKEQTATTGTCAGADFDAKTGVCSNLQS